VDSNSFGKEFDVPGFVVKIVKDGDAYQMYYWLAEPDEFRLLEKTESGFTLNGESIYLSEDKNTLYIEIEG